MQEEILDEFYKRFITTGGRKGNNVYLKASPKTLKDFILNIIKTVRENERKRVLGKMYDEVQKAALQTIPLYEYTNEERTDFVMTKEHLYDYARRVYKVALEDADWI